MPQVETEQCQIFHVNDKYVRVTATGDSDSRKVVDVEILGNPQNPVFRDFLRSHPERESHWSTSCYTALLQNALARCRAHHLALDKEHRGEYKPSTNEIKIRHLIGQLEYAAALFIPFEEMINHGEDIAELKRRLGRYKEQLPDTSFSEELRGDLLKKVEAFERNVAAAEGMALTERQVLKLFCVQGLSEKIQALGDFICQQMMTMLDAIMLAMSDIRLNPVGDAFAPMAEKNYLSDAKDAIGKKGLSLYGKRYNNTYAAVPPAMISGCRLRAPAAVIPNDALPEGQAWVSILPLAGSTHPEVLDAVVCDYTYAGLDKPKRDTASGWNVGLVVLASTAELALSVPYRLGLTVVATATGLIPTCGFPLAHRIDGFAAVSHDFLSRNIGLTAAKRRAQRAFAAAPGAADTDLAQAYKGAPTNFYYDMFTQYFRGERVAAGVRSSVVRMGTAFANIKREPSYILMDRHAKQSRLGEIFEEMQQEIGAKEHELLEILRKNFNPALPAPGASTPLTATPKLDGTLAAPENYGAADDGAKQIPEEIARAQVLDIYQRWQANEFHSVLDFVDEIVNGLSNYLVNPMFRRAPGFATLFFAVACASLATLMMPDLAKNEIGSVLEAIPAWISQNFTGKPVDEGMASRIVAVFIEWKLGFFGAEILASCAKGDFSTLKRIFANPEKITLGLMVFVAAGYALGEIPALPTKISIGSHKILNPFAGVLNFFSNESRHSGDGQIPLNAIEYAFLGLKFSILVYSMLTGTHDAEHNAIDCAALAKNLQQKGLLLRENAAQRGEIIAAAFAEQGIRINLQSQSDKRDLDTMSALADEVIASRSGAEHDDAADAGYQAAEQINPYQQNNIDQESSIAIQKEQLRTALQLVQRFERFGLNFKDNKDARIFYDYLHDRFEAYNHALALNGRTEEQVDARECLHSFYNKYCYGGSPTLFRLATTTVLYPATILWREGKRSAAETEAYHSPSTLAQVEKSYAKDRAMAYQVVALGAETGKAFLLAVSWLGRGATGFIMVPAWALAKCCHSDTASATEHRSERLLGDRDDESAADGSTIAVPVASTWYTWLEHGVKTVFDLHRQAELPAPSGARDSVNASHADSARVAGTTDDLREQLPQLIYAVDDCGEDQLFDAPAEVEELPANAEPAARVTAARQALARFERDYPKRSQSYATTKILERLGVVVKTYAIEHKEKPHEPERAAQGTAAPAAGRSEGHVAIPVGTQPLSQTQLEEVHRNAVKESTAHTNCYARFTGFFSCGDKVAKQREAARALPALCESVGRSFGYRQAAAD